MFCVLHIPLLTNSSYDNITIGWQRFACNQSFCSNRVKSRNKTAKLECLYCSYGCWYMRKMHNAGCVCVLLKLKLIKLYACIFSFTNSLAKLSMLIVTAAPIRLSSTTHSEKMSISEWIVQAWRVLLLSVHYKSMHIFWRYIFFSTICLPLFASLAISLDTIALKWGKRYERKLW